MSFGDIQKGPLGSFMNSTLGQFDALASPLIGGKKASSLLSAPEPLPPITKPSLSVPQSVDTPGRHKSLLGA